MASALPDSNQAVPPLSYPGDTYTTCITSAYKALKRRFSLILQKNDSLTKKEKSLRQQLNQALRDNFQIRGELRRLHESYDILARDAGRISMERSQVYEQLENERFERELGDLVLNQYKDEIKERKQEIEREVFKKELGDLLLAQYRGEIEAQDRAIREKDIHIEAFKASVAAASSEISTLNSEVLNWKRRVTIGEEQILNLARKLEGNNEQITRQNTVIAQLEKERSEAMDGCRYFEAQIGELKTTYHELLLRVNALSAGYHEDEQTKEEAVKAH
ncbi:hypothetical protein FPOAC1_007254 [Fusarium poae]|uniref:hypothetical protein n=1 Tax=Fusarium poae TaxID=36050 RepID=UPI001CEBE28E|nr:hypothetical protein FPOAC1_007254 [Fusarium poae]KAG8673935.1 hypothetical protein FPOAC1_007254 [Fusarium poae]